MANKVPTEIIVDGKDISGMQRQELQKHIVQITHSLLLERGEITKTRKECDIMRTFWQNIEKDFEDAKAAVMKKYLQESVLWDQYKEPYEEKEQEISFQKYMLNFDAQYNDKENQKRIDIVASKWEKEVLPEMMETKTKEALRFDKKQDEMNKEYKAAQEEYEKIIDTVVKKKENKMLDWEVLLYQRTLIRKQYQDLQFLLKKFFCSEQKNLLIHDLKAAHKVNFQKMRTVIRERIKGDLMQIISLRRDIEKLNNQYENTNKNIEEYKVMVEKKEAELNELQKTLKLYELRLNSYKQNIDVANRSCKKIEKLNKDNAVYDKRRKELEEEVNRRQKVKYFYLNLLLNLKEEVNKLQKQYLGGVFEDVLNKHLKNMEEFDKLFEDFERKSPQLAREAKEKLFQERKELERLPLLVTKEIKSHNDFIDSAVAKLKEMGMRHVPQLLHIKAGSFPTGTGPATGWDEIRERKSLKTKLAAHRSFQEKPKLKTGKKWTEGRRREWELMRRYWANAKAQRRKQLKYRDP